MELAVRTDDDMGKVVAIGKTTAVPAFTVSSFGVKPKLSIFTSVPAATAGRVKMTPRAAVAKIRHKPDHHTLERFALVKLRMLVSFCEVGLAGCKWCIGDREGLFSTPDLDARQSQQSAQLFGRHQHRA